MAVRRENGRGDRIRTCDILLPKQARYRAALLPEPPMPLGFERAEGKRKELPGRGERRVPELSIAAISSARRDRPRDQAARPLQRR